MLISVLLFVLNTAANAGNEQLVFNKSFADSSVEIGAVTTLTFTLENPAGVSAQDVAFTDNLPIGLAVAATPNVTNNCPGGTLTATAGSTTISYSGGTIPGVPMPGSTCTITVDIEGIAVGMQNNLTTALTTSTPTIDDSTPAMASIDVTLVEIEWDLAGTGDWFVSTNWNPDQVPNFPGLDTADEVATINNGGTAMVIDDGSELNNPVIILAADLNIGTNGGDGNLTMLPVLSTNNIPFSAIGYSSSINIGTTETGSNPATPSTGTLTVNSAPVPFTFVPLDSDNPGELNIGASFTDTAATGNLTLTSNLAVDPTTQIFSDIAIGIAEAGGNATGTVLVDGTSINSLLTNEAEFRIGLSVASGNANGTLTGGSLFGVPVLVAGYSGDAGDSTAMLTSIGVIGAEFGSNTGQATIGVSEGTGNANAEVNQDLDLQTITGFGPFGTVDIGVADSTGSATGSLVASAGMRASTVNIGISNGGGMATGSLLIDHGLLIASTLNLGNDSTLTLNLNGPNRSTSGDNINDYSGVNVETANLDGDLIVNLQFTPNPGQVFVLIDTPIPTGINGAFDSMTVNNLPTGLTAAFSQANGDLLLTIGGTLTPPNWTNPNTGAGAGDWFDTGNWSNATVPASGDIATINNGGTAAANAGTAPGDMIAAEIIAGVDGGSGSVDSMGVDITTSNGILVGLATPENMIKNTAQGNLTITNAEINTGIGFSNNNGIIGVGMASGVATANGQLTVTDSNLNPDDGIVVGFAGAGDTAASSTGTGSFIYDGISPAASTINLNNGNLRIGDTSNDPPENSVMTATGSASIQDVTIIGGEIQVTELSPDQDDITQIANAPMVNLSNVVVIDSEIDVATVNIDAVSSQSTANATTTLTDVSFTNVSGSDNFQSGDVSANAMGAVISSITSQTWTRVSIDAQSNIEAGITEASNNGTVTLQAAINIIDSDLMINNFDIGNLNSAGFGSINNTTTINVSQNSTINASSLVIAQGFINDVSQVNLNAGVNITDSEVIISDQVTISQLEGSGNISNNSVTANLTLSGSSLTADAVNISVINQPAGTVDASLNLNPSLVSVDDVGLGMDGSITFGLEGLSRVSMGTIGVPGTYAAIDTFTGVLDGEVIADFNFVPPPGTHSFDLIVAGTSLNADAATLTVNNLPPLFNIVDFGVISESKLSILRLTIEGGNDLSISKLNGEVVLDELAQTTYLITVSNAGVDTANNVNVIDNLPPTLGSATWVCTAIGGASCPAPNTGNGNINELVDIPAGGSVEFALTATVVGSEGQTVTNTASLVPPPGFIDAFADNNSDTDEDGIGLFIDSFEAAEEE